MEIAFVLFFVGPAVQGRKWAAIAASIGGLLSATFVAEYSLRSAAFSVTLAVIVVLAFLANRWLRRVGAITPYVEKIVSGVVVPYVDSDEKAR